jgi:hypothetical protein
MTMIEKVARAIEEADRTLSGYELIAKAAIEAMREPTVEMEFAPDRSELDARDQSTIYIWQSMIDAALGTSQNHSGVTTPQP